MTPQPLGPIEYEPITLAEAQLHLKLDTVGSPPAHTDDALVESLIVAVREHAENYTGRAFARQAYSLTLDEFPMLDDQIDLGIWPVLSIDSVTYVDPEGVTDTLDSVNYVLMNYTKPARMALSFDGRWPSVRNQPGAVTITFTAGCTDSSPNTHPLPQSAKAAMLLMLGHLYENREALGKKDDNVELPLGVMALLQQHRIAIGL